MLQQPRLYEHKCAALKRDDISSRRSETEAALAHIELPEFNTNCIECLVDIAAVPEEDKTAAAKYLEEHRDELKKNAKGIVDGYIRKAITDFFDEDRVIYG